VRLVLYTGKGGVGKTTTAAATAAAAAERGVRTLILSSDAAHSLGDVLDAPLASVPVALGPKLDAVEIDARAEIGRHYGTIRDYLVELFRYQGIDEVVAEELALLPGAEEVAALLAVEQFSRSADYDFVVVDCAPTGSTLRLISLPDMLTGALRMAPSLIRLLSTVVSPVVQAAVRAPIPQRPVFRQLEQLVEERAVQLRARLGSRDTSVRIVATPERMVIDEARRAFMEISLFGLSCDAVVMNRLLPDSVASEEFFQESFEKQGKRRDELAAAFAPVALLEAPLQRDEVIGLEALAAHGAQIFADQEPNSLVSEAPHIRFTRTRDGHRVHLPLPGASPEKLDVAVVEDELIVRAGARRRAIPLPPRIARLPLESARLDEGDLVVSFRAAVSGSEPD